MDIEKFNNNYDVFKSFLVEKADYDGKFEMPKIFTSNQIPNGLVCFSEAMSKNHKDFDKWVMFYEHDQKFERLWNNPKAYLDKLKKFDGVISPDFSLYYNMPLVMQMWNTYRSRALGVWLQRNGVNVIPNVRWGDERTYSFCFDGIEQGKTVAVGTYGCMRRNIDRDYFEKGLAELVKRLSPKTIIVYGLAPDYIFDTYKKSGINIINFEGEFFKSKRQVNA